MMVHPDNQRIFFVFSISWLPESKHKMGPIIAVTAVFFEFFCFFFPKQQLIQAPLKI